MDLYLFKSGKQNKGRSTRKTVHPGDGTRSFTLETSRGVGCFHAHGFPRIPGELGSTVLLPERLASNLLCAFRPVTSPL